LALGNLAPVGQPSVDSILEQLRESGGRITSARRAVVAALVEPSDHRTAEDLIALVQATCPDVAPSTVYRILESLEEIGVVVHVHLGHGAAVYHLSETSHAHVVCEDCGRVVEVPPDLAKSIADGIRDRLDFWAALRHFSITGRCRACEAKRSKKARQHHSDERA
jgi:Fur family transcriptional regulator, ferric uptake regulator